MKIEGKIAIVTGASSGIGLSTAKLLTKKGAKVALVARSKLKLIKLSKMLPGSFVVVCDIREEKEVRKMIKKVFAHFGKIDILINNAGRGYDTTVEKINTKYLREIFELDLVGPVVAMQEAIPIMKKQKMGSIVNISSGTALMFLPNMSAYSSLKRALVGITLTAREELKKDNIGISVVYPYITDTNFEKNTIKGEGIWDEGDGPPIPGDSPEFVAQKIVEAIEKNKPEVFAHDWMGKGNS